MDVEVLRVVHLVIPDDTECLEETILGVFVSLSVLRLREQQVAIVCD